MACLRKARKMTQAEAAARAGLSRSTAVLIEAGDPSRTLAQAAAVPKRVRASAPKPVAAGEYDF